MRNHSGKLSTSGISRISEVSLSEGAQLALRAAHELAATLEHQSCEPEHLLLALLDAEGSGAGQIAREAAVDFPRLRLQLRGLMRGFRCSSNRKRLERTLDAACRLTKRLRTPYIGTEHLLAATVGIVRVSYRRLLADAGITAARILDDINSMHGAVLQEPPTTDWWNKKVKKEMQAALSQLAEKQPSKGGLSLEAHATAAHTQRTPVRPDGIRIVVVGRPTATPSELGEMVELALCARENLGWMPVQIAPFSHDGGCYSIILFRRSQNTERT